MGAEVIILANPYTYNFLKGLTHSALYDVLDHTNHTFSESYATLYPLTH